MNRQVPKPIWNMSGNTHKMPETTGKQPLREGEHKCYECGQKGHMRSQCPKLRNWCIVAVPKQESVWCMDKVKAGIHVDQQNFYWRNSRAHSITTVCTNMRHLQSWKFSWNGRTNFWVESSRWSLTTKVLNISRPNQTCCWGRQGGGNIFPASITIPSM